VIPQLEEVGTLLVLPIDPQVLFLKPAVDTPVLLDLHLEEEVFQLCREICVVLAFLRPRPQPVDHRRTHKGNGGHREEEADTETVLEGGCHQAEARR